MIKKPVYEVIRSNRKTIALVVDSNATLVVRAPFSVSDNEINEVVTKRQFWIAEKRKQVETFAINHPKVEMKDGAGVMYLGNSYTIAKDAVTNFKVAEPFIYAPENATVETFTKWLKDEALTILTERVKKYASIMGVEYSNQDLALTGRMSKVLRGQVRICKELAESKGLMVINIYPEKARTGTNDDRPSFQRMIKDAASGAFHIHNRLYV